MDTGELILYTLGQPVTGFMMHGDLVRAGDLESDMLDQPRVAGGTLP